MPNPNQPKKNAKDDLLKALLGSECVRYFPQLAEYVGGAQAALMLSQLLYWNARNDGKPVLKSVEDMQRETGLSPAEQVTARDRLDAIGVCPSELRGMPRIWHYYPSIDAVAELVGSGVVWRDNPLNTDKRKSNRVVLDGDDKKPIERLNHSMEKSVNVVGKNRTTLPEKISQLNKELETTVLETTKDIKTEDDKEASHPKNQTIARRAVGETPKAPEPERTQAQVKREIVSLYERNIGPVVPIISDEIDAAMRDYPSLDLWRDAITKTALNSGRSWQYLAAVLRGGAQGGPGAKAQSGPYQRKQPKMPGYVPGKPQALTSDEREARQAARRAEAEAMMAGAMTLDEMIAKGLAQ